LFLEAFVCLEFPAVHGEQNLPKSFGWRAPSRSQKNQNNFARR
jgi:hypothetical protein